MLSCYECGVTLPSLPSLTATLRALGADFNALQEALDKVGERETEVASAPSLRARAGRVLRSSEARDFRRTVAALRVSRDVQIQIENV
jgi:hypothetical protein